MGASGDDSPGDGAHSLTSPREDGEEKGRTRYQVLGCGLDTVRRFPWILCGAGALWAVAAARMRTRVMFEIRSSVGALGVAQRRTKHFLLGCTDGREDTGRLVKTFPKVGLLSKRRLVLLTTVVRAGTAGREFRLGWDVLLASPEMGSLFMGAARSLKVWKVPTSIEESPGGY